MRNRFENQSRTIKRRERSKTGVKNTEEEEEEKGMEGRVERSRAVGEEEEDDEEENTERSEKKRERKGVEGRPVESPGGRKKG